jgi:hypothetical protein
MGRCLIPNFNDSHGNFPRESNSFLTSFQERLARGRERHP